MAVNFSWFSIVCVIFLVSPAACGENLFSFVLGTRCTSSEHEEPIASRIRVKTYTGSLIETALSSDIPVQEAEVLYDYIDQSKPLVLYIHGYWEHPANESIRTVVGAHLERGNDNVMLLDWSDLAFENYVTVAGRVQKIATILARTFDGLVQLGLELETFHLIGHSLGAQIAGFVGKYSRYSIPRITGLDPAKPCFYYPGAEHIDARSARFVDVIHTDGGVYGALSRTGSVDFFANSGTRPQPGCPLVGIPLSAADLCSHWRSWRYYAESVLNELAFPAVQCHSYRDFLLDRCAENRSVYFGYATSTDARGSFYFATNDKTPFGKSSSTYAENRLES